MPQPKREEHQPNCPSLESDNNMDCYCSTPTPSGEWESDMRSAIHRTLGNIVRKEVIDEVADEYISATQELLTKAKADTKAECVRKLEGLKKEEQLGEQGWNKAIDQAIHSLEE